MKFVTEESCKIRRMAAEAKPKGGLEDVVATSSRICFLDGDRGVLAYCGHDIHDLARHDRSRPRPWPETGGEIADRDRRLHAVGTLHEDPPAALGHRHHRRFRLRHRGANPTAERLLGRGEHGFRCGITDDHEEGVVRPVVGRVIRGNTGAVDRRQAFQRRSGARVRMVAKQRLAEHLVRHRLRRRHLRLELLRGVGLAQVNFGLREGRVAHDIGQQVHHARQ